MIVPVYHTSPWMLPFCILVALLYWNRNRSKPEKLSKEQKEYYNKLHQVLYTKFETFTHLEHIIYDRGVTDDGKLYLDLKCCTLDRIDRIEGRDIEDLKQKVKEKSISNILKILRRPIDDHLRETLEDCLKGQV